MSYQELLELNNKRAEKVREGEGLLAKKDFDAHKTLMGEVQKMNAEIDAAESQLAEEGRFAEGDAKMKALHAQKQQEKADAAAEKSADDIRSEPEYAKAWVEALRTGMTVKKSMGVEKFNILH